MADFPTTGVEIIDVIEKDITSNKYAVSMDSKTWNGGKKSSTEWKHERANVVIRVFDTSMASLMAFIEANKHILTRFIFNGYTHFNRTTSTNYGYMINHTNPKQIAPRLSEFEIEILRQDDP